MKMCMCAAPREEQQRWQPAGADPSPKLRAVGSRRVFREGLTAQKPGEIFIFSFACKQHPCSTNSIMPLTC